MTIDGVDKGIRKMMLTYVPNRPVNNSAPTTHLNYDAATANDIHSDDYLNAVIAVEQSDSGEYSLTITRQDVA